MMLTHLLICSVLLFITTLVHAGFTVCAIRVLHRLNAEHRWMQTTLQRVLLITALVIAMFLAAVIEVLVYAGTYLWFGALEGLEKAVYFSMVTFTTLGYGDVLLTEDWRLMAAFEAANGIILFGWTTALIFAFVQRMASYHK
jgi:hypothetical protein